MILALARPRDSCLSLGLVILALVRPRDSCLGLGLMIFGSARLGLIIFASALALFLKSCLSLDVRLSDA